jgi:NADH pyrophosphatase NudC (nudix superfamily)
VKLCKYCGNELADSAKFCGECGKPQVDDEKETVAVPGDEASMKTAPQYEENEKSVLKKDAVELAKLLVKKENKYCTVCGKKL